MEENNEKTNIEVVSENLNVVEPSFVGDTKSNESEQPKVEEEKTVNVTFRGIAKWCLYILGVVFLLVGMSFYFKDVDYYSSPMQFHEERYVGGDAYNYIISAARSAAVMIKSLIWVVMGCSSIIIGRTFSATKK